MAGDLLELQLSDARNDATSLLLLGFSKWNVPFQSGVLVPAIDFVIPFPTGASGGYTLNTNWPANIPAGTSLLSQVWVLDPLGVGGYAASNAVSGTTPWELQ